MAGKRSLEFSPVDFHADNEKLETEIPSSDNREMVTYYETGTAVRFNEFFICIFVDIHGKKCKNSGLLGH